MSEHAYQADDVDEPEDPDERIRCHEWGCYYPRAFNELIRIRAIVAVACEQAWPRAVKP
jgi:hypothetical protein